jgi:catechol 2,3-dioxygenase-like lactoylglutathione lyase family enzyme
MSLPIATRGLRHLALRVRDVARAQTFYSEIFGMQTVWQPDADNCYLSSGCDNLALHRRPAGDAAPAEAQVLDHLGFIVPTAEAVWAAAEVLRARQVPIVKEPRHHRDGSCSVYCADPDGNIVQILFEPTISPLTCR